jgi:hypothetical protein
MFKTSICKFDKSSFRITDEGYLDAEVWPTRAGVFTYFYGGKMVRELRRPEEVFKADSLSQLEQKPVTNGHPKDPMGNFIFLDRKTARDHSVGVVYGKHDKADDGTHTKARVMVYDEAMIKDIESGKAQVSCAYECDYLEQPGVYDGLEYDREQVNIRNYNHLAILERGRAGSGASIKLDGLEIDPEELNELSKEGDHPMIKFKLDGAEVEISEQSVEKIAAVDSKLKADAAQITELSEKASTLATERDQLQGKFDALSQEVEQFRQAHAQAQLSQLKDKAAGYVDSKKLDGLTERQIKETVVSAKFDGIDLSQKTDGEIEGMFAVVTLEQPKETPNMRKIDGAINNPKPYAGVDLIEAARLKNISESVRG